MILDIVLFVLGLIFILIAGELFTNGIEAIGDKLNLSKNFTGSVLAAVGTALPETILPIIAVLFFAETGHEIGVGAILGAPFMLSTLAFPLVGLTIITASLMKKRNFSINIEENGIRRDLAFFLFAYTVALFIVPFENYPVKIITAVFLLSLYIFYVYLTLKSDSEGMEEVEHLYFAPKSENPSLFIMIFQTVFALVLMIGGAHIFVEGIKEISLKFGFSPLLFSLLVAPIATELPEKINSVLWTWRGKDTLAIGNISGAMVFQSTIPVSFGILFTQWNIEGLALISGIFAVVAASFVMVLSFASKKLIPIGLSIGIIFYLVYLYMVLTQNGIMN
ncbi:sodium:calcium antiporter [Hydrogenothermus marinus]|uniref:Cation:H+ antiporter n=1 Tax=Hydrogenothermus marinus TaxID=133270 RepID=A0A3M0BG38_9AQUI|nr:sodium:calcium antiporter [Hydrogenothermus marinus]RMA95997.1 cation:H+ antiporter [Hydrogenothermus marinus]